MRLSTLLSAEMSLPSRFFEIEVGKPCLDSRLLQKNDVFFSENGASYIEEAIRKGASAIITDSEPSENTENIPVFRVSNIRKSYALAWQAYTEHPEKQLRFFAVTGTNGKTSVAHFLSELFRFAGHKVGQLGTVGNFDGEKTTTADYTTPPPEILYPLLRTMCENGVTHVVMEASSHAIAQERLYGLHFETAIFTNLTRDHLDYHKTEDVYKAAKAALFANAAHSILNLGDPASRDMAWCAAGDVCYYGREIEAEAYVENPVCTAKTMQYTLHIGKESLPLELPLVGNFHIENSAAAIVTAHLAGIPSEILKEAAKHLHAPAGRLEKLNTNTPYSVYIDYAHTPDALRKALSALRPHTDRLTVLFGAGGDRDRGKRPEMGKAADLFADRIILTSDNPRSEDPEAIMADILTGIEQKETVCIQNRKEAIEYALSAAKAGEIILLAGKGHETYLIDRTGKHPFSERAIVNQYLERKGQSDV